MWLFTRRTCPGLPIVPSKLESNAAPKFLLLTSWQKADTIRPAFSKFGITKQGEEQYLAFLLPVKQ